MRSRHLLTFFLGLSLLMTGSQSLATLECRGVFSVLKHSQIERLRTRDQKNMAYKSTGPAEAEQVFIFLNGIDKDMNEWNQLRDKMAEAHPASGFIQLDLFGQGQTAKLNRHSSQVISYREQVSALKELIQQQNLVDKKIILVGHSYGGGIAARFVSDNPGVVSDAILISPYVDDLETHQYGVGPYFLMAKNMAKMLGAQHLYESAVHTSFSMAANMHWMGYRGTGKTTAGLSDILSLTSGIRHLGMSQAVQNAGATRLHFIVAKYDILIPNSAHEHLWKMIPSTNRGAFITIAASHESVSEEPDIVEKALESIISD